jgi:two-component system phosphate regulon sensor histidine kinase PhoR
MKLSLQWKWFLGLTGLLAALLLLVTVCIDISLPPYLRQRVQQDLERNCRLVHHLTAPALAATPLNTNEVNNLAHALGRQTGLRVTLITLNGTVVGESDKPPHELAGIENHLHRPEVQDALQRGLGIARRHSDTVNVDLLYVALPALPPGAYAPRGVVRVAIPLHAVAETTGRVRRIVAMASLIVALIDIPFLFWLARRYSEPIDAMRKMAGRVAGGDFSARAPYRVGGELGELGLALNDMAGQLDTRLRELGEEKAGLAAILSSMTEGVLVTDAAGRIRLLNRALRQQFQLTDAALGKTVLEVFRNVELEKLIAAPTARELTFHAPTERNFVVNAAALANETGVVIVFHDISRIKQLETLRQEFVANVSHELRTPVSVIRGYVETLREEPPPDPATTRQFLATVQKHARQLEALIEDLLNISALESQQARIEFGPVPVSEVVAAVIDELNQQIRDKAMTVTANLPADLPAARADRERLHQVFVNLLGNALKYTPAKGQVTISARATGNEIEYCVADNGPGIAAEHLPRVFERFYRVDKARSRELGGTGLGLSIVKHIVQAHGGRVWAVSEAGKGSRFYFTLPAA